MKKLDVKKVLAELNTSGFAAVNFSVSGNELVTASELMKVYKRIRIKKGKKK